MRKLPHIVCVVLPAAVLSSGCSLIQESNAGPAKPDYSIELVIPVIADIDERNAHQQLDCLGEVGLSYVIITNTSNEIKTFDDCTCSPKLDEQFVLEVDERGNTPWIFGTELGRTGGVRMCTANYCRKHSLKPGDKLIAPIPCWEDEWRRSIPKTWVSWDETWEGYKNTYVQRHARIRVLLKEFTLPTVSKKSNVIGESDWVEADIHAAPLVTEGSR